MYTYRWVDVCLCQCESLVEEHEDEMIATFGQELPDYEHAICVELTGQPLSLAVMFTDENKAPKAVLSFFTFCTQTSNLALMLMQNLGHKALQMWYKNSDNSVL